jgi:L-lactate dehydrogenase complex protein LldF
MKNISFFWRKVNSGWKTIMMHRWMLDKPGSKLKNRMVRRFGKKLWGPRRVLPKFAPKSFRELWKERSESSQNT